MKRASLVTTALGMAALLILSACGGPSIQPSARGEGEGGAITPTFGQFSDIPVPSGANMDLDRTLILGGGDSWMGRLSYSTRQSVGEMFDFHKAEMMRFGWQELASLRSATSVLTYQRSERVATVQIRPATILGAVVDFTVAPQGGAGGGGASGSHAPAPAMAPASAPITSSPLPPPRR
jgi:hypothetical protein